MCRDDGIKTLEAFSGDLSVLLSQLEAIQTRMKADINAQIGAQLTYLDSVISRAQMNSLKLEGLSTNLMEESPLTTVVNNYSSLAKELAAQDDLSQLKVG